MPGVRPPAADSQARKPRRGLCRRERKTFLARYPRKLKLGVVGGCSLIVIGVIPGFSFRRQRRTTERKTGKVSAVVSGADSRAAIANPAPAPIPGTLGVTKSDTKNRR